MHSRIKSPLSLAEKCRNLKPCRFVSIRAEILPCGVVTYLNGLKICLAGSIDEVADKQNLLLFSIITLFLVLKWGYLGVVFAAIFLIPGLAILQYLSSALSDEARLALSFPVSLILTSGLMFSLHRAGLDLPVNWFAIIPIAAIGILIWNRTKFEIKLGSKDQIIAIIVFLLFLNTFYSTLQKDAVPATDGSNHLYKTWVTLQGMEEYGKILEWSKYMYSGHTLFVFYPPLAYVSPAMLTHFAGVPVHKAFNFFAFWAILYAGIGVYLLAKKIGVNELLAWAAAIILITTPNLLGKVFYQGNYAIVLAFSFFAIITYLGLELKNKNMLWLAFPVAAVLMIHSLIFYYVTFLVLFIAIWLFFARKEKTEGKLVVASLVIAALLSSSWLMPFLANFSQMHVAERPIPVSIPEFLNHVTFVPKDVTDCATNSLQCMQSFTQIYILLFLLGTVAALISKNQNAIFVLLCLAVVMTVIFAEITPLLKILPLREKMMGVGYRTYFFILPFFAVICGYGVDLFSRKNKRLNYAAAVVFLISIYAATAFWIPNTDVWMKENTAIAYSGDRALMFDDIKQLIQGRIVVYGLYGPAITAAIPIMTDRDVFYGWGYETAGDILKMIYKIQDYDFNANSETSPEDTLRIFRETNVNNILVFICDKAGKDAFENVLMPMNSSYVIAFNRGGCLIMINVIPESYFSEYEDGTEIKYKRLPELINLTIDKAGTILIKEAYSSNWYATLDGKYVNIEKTETGYMRTKADNAGSLVLTYRLTLEANAGGGVGSILLFLYSISLARLSNAKGE